MDPTPPAEPTQPARLPPWTPAPNTLPNYPPYQPPPRTSHTAIIVLSIVLAVVLCIAGAEGIALALGSGVFQSHGSTSHGVTWVTVANYDSSQVTSVPASNTSYITPVFSVSAPWRFQWSCVSNDPTHYADIFRVMVVEEHGHILDRNAVNKTCSSETVSRSGTVDEDQAGRFVLMIDALTKWNITVQSR